MKPSLSKRLSELAGVFLKLGLIGFGGPAAHIAMMHDETVLRRRWLTDGEFLDLVGATNLIPGPNSTEMAIHLGFRRAGWPGLIVAGACFILPAVLIVTAMTWAYVRYGATPQAEGLLYGIKPVVIAIIAQALWTLGPKAVKDPLTGVVGFAVLILYFLGINEIALLFGGGLAVLAGSNLKAWRKGAGIFLAPPFAGPGLLGGVAAASFSLPLLFLTFLKIGAVLYGGGYVLLAFLRADFVVRFGWLTDAQLMDAVAVGQVTPGPLFTTATFIGYLLGGLPGALIATLGIFLPAFLFVAVSNPLIPRIRSSASVGGLLDGVNAASIGLMAAVGWQLGRVSVADPLALLIALVSLVLLVRFRLHSTWLIAGGAAAGLLKAAL